MAAEKFRAIGNQVCTEDGYPIATTFVMGKAEPHDLRLAAWIVACLNAVGDSVPYEAEYPSEPPYEGQPGTKGLEVQA